ncbi:hypothetical protein CVT24_005048 [Panaeolus cyanescens]|uniref:F-box domain-containing protein n=1 Tax=Panaeolus cyanescens TaxID=181874 RepID=A0A409VPQ1_9AGAR|nr:hypothetical protein CVT24_005048 [Panaeolus cyanescens]
MSLTSLSAEILLKISSYLVHRDRKDLRLTCNALADIIATDVLCGVVIDIQIDGGYRYESGRIRPQLDMLRWMGGGANRRVDAIRHLRIKSLSVANDSYLSKLEPAESEYSEDQDEDDDDDDDVIRVPNDTEEVMHVLIPALKALRNVQTFIWDPEPKDPAVLQGIVAEIVSQYPRLEQVVVDLPDVRSPLLSRFKNLRYLSGFSQSSTEVSRPVMEAFAQVMAQSQTSLKHFKFNFGLSKMTGRNKLPAFAFKQCSNSSVVLRLRTLHLERCVPSKTLVPHLAQLSTLRLLQSPPDFVKSKKGKRMFENFWSAIKDAGIQLQHIAVDAAPNSLVAYLKSYAGLKSFKLCKNSSIDFSVDGIFGSAERFYEEGLVRHYETLNELEISLSWEDKWCFRRTYQSTISQCRRLKILGLGLGFRQLGGDSKWRTPSELLDVEEPNLVFVLLDTIAIHCPSLKKLTIYAPTPGDSSFGSELMEEKITGWVPPPGLTPKALPYIRAMVHCCWEGFTAVYNTDKQGVRYRLSET